MCFNKYYIPRLQLWNWRGFLWRTWLSLWKFPDYSTDWQFCRKLFIHRSKWNVLVLRYEGMCELWSRFWNISSILQELFKLSPFFNCQLAGIMLNNGTFWFCRLPWDKINQINHIHIVFWWLEVQKRFFKGRFFKKFALFMISVEELFIIKSRLWWCGFGISENN